MNGGGIKLCEQTYFIDKMLVASLLLCSYTVSLVERAVHFIVCAATNSMFPLYCGGN